MSVISAEVASVGSLGTATAAAQEYTCEGQHQEHHPARLRDDDDLDVEAVQVRGDLHL